MTRFGAQRRIGRNKKPTKPASEPEAKENPFKVALERRQKAGVTPDDPATLRQRAAALRNLV